MLSMFVLASQDNWEQAMFAGMDVTSAYTGPIVNYNIFLAFYYLAFMIVGSFFVIQLFVGVFIDTFQTVVAERKVLSRQSSLATDTTENSSAHGREPTDPIRLLLYDIVHIKVIVDLQSNMIFCT